MIRDASTDAARLRPPLPALREGLAETVPCGSVALGGNGWLAVGAERTAAVRLERHTGRPPADTGWDDVLETPYHCATGAIGFTGTLAPVRLTLGSPGTYTTRVCVRGAGEHRTVRVQFWPANRSPRPPRWLLRSRPPLGDHTWGWDEVLPTARGTELRQAVAGAAARHGGSASPDEIAAWSAAAGEPAFLDLPMVPETLRIVDGFIAAAGLATPATMRDLPDLFVAAGLFAAEDRGGTRRYRPVDPPPHPRDVLGLSVMQLIGLDMGDDIARYSPFEADLVNLVAWANGAPTSVAALAVLLLADIPDVLDTLRHAVSLELLEVHGPADPATDAAAPIVVTAAFADD